MANKVFGYFREISGKAAIAKTICAFADVCFTSPDKVPSIVGKNQRKRSA